ncbi:MAG: PAS domain S-box protein, partial [Candidatus Binataceae bacterium]
MQADQKSRQSKDVQPPGSPAGGPAQTEIGTLDALEESALAAAAAPSIRRGAIVIGLFNVFVLGGAPLWGISNPAMIVVSGCLNAALAFAFAALTFGDWFGRHWRIASLVLGAVLVTSATITYTLLGNTDALLLRLSLLVIGVGALVPWSPKWQALLSALALLAAGLHLGTMAGRESAPADHVFGLLFSILIGQMITSLCEHNRRESARAFADLQESHDQLHAEMALREQAAGEREAAQVKLRESEQALRRIFDAATDIIVVRRLSDGAYLDANRAMYNTGFTLEELQQQSAQGGWWVSDAQRNEMWRELRERGQVQNVEAQARAKDGAVRAQLISAVCVDLHGEPCAVFFVRDITDVKQAQAELLESEQTLRRVFDAIPDAVIIARMDDATFVDANVGIQTLGMTREQALSGRRRASDLFPGRDARLAFIEQLNADGAIRNFEANANLADGTTIPTLVSSTVVKLRGEPCAVIVVRDISEIKATETRLRESETTLRKIFDASPDSITLNRLSDGTWVNLSDSFATTTGFNTDEALGKTAAHLGIWTDGAQLTEYLHRLRSDGVVRNMEITARMRDGREVPTLISAAIVEFNGEAVIVTFTRDISVLKQTQAELVEAREAALAASRAKSEFLSSMSHEIRTPLNSILGMADLLAETEMTAEQRHFANTMVSNGNALLQIINDILDLARIESGRIA